MGSGIVSINIDTLRAQLLTNPSSEFGSEELNIEDGTMSAPVPTKLYLEPITRALDDKFWMNRLGDSTQSAEAAQAFNYLLIRRTNLEWQLEGYAEEVGTTLQGNATVSVCGKLYTFRFFFLSNFQIQI